MLEAKVDRSIIALLVFLIALVVAGNSMYMNTNPYQSIGGYYPQAAQSYPGIFWPGYDFHSSGYAPLTSYNPQQIVPSLNYETAGSTTNDAEATTTSIQKEAYETGKAENMAKENRPFSERDRKVNEGVDQFSELIPDRLSDANLLHLPVFSLGPTESLKDQDVKTAGENTLSVLLFPLSSLGPSSTKIPFRPEVEEDSSLLETTAPDYGETINGKIKKSTPLTFEIGIHRTSVLTFDPHGLHRDNFKGEGATENNMITDKLHSSMPGDVEDTSSEVADEVITNPSHWFGPFRFPGSMWSKILELSQQAKGVGGLESNFNSPAISAFDPQKVKDLDSPEYVDSLRRYVYSPSAWEYPHLDDHFSEPEIHITTTEQDCSLLAGSCELCTQSLKCVYCSSTQTCHAIDGWKVGESVTNFCSVSYIYTFGTCKANALSVVVISLLTCTLLISALTFLIIFCVSRRSKRNRLYAKIRRKEGELKGSKQAMVLEEEDD